MDFSLRREEISQQNKALAALTDYETGVTVAIPCYNQGEFLERALDSVYGQTVPPREVIVVDDGSDVPIVLPDTTRRASKIDARVIRVTNRGLPSARNTALMLARHEAFLPLDADDWLAPTYIEKTLPLLGGADVVLTGLQEHGEIRNGAFMPGYDRPYDQVDEETLWSYNRFFYCSLFRTDVLREMGGYHPRMAGWPGVNGGFEDWDLWIGLKRKGARFAAVNEILFHYSTRSNSMLAAAERNRDALVNEMRRHHGSPS